MEMELADDAVLMINGIEINPDELDADSGIYYFTINPKDKITLGLDPKTNLIKSASMNLKTRKARDEEVGRPKVNGAPKRKKTLSITIEPQEEVYYAKVVWRPNK